jgi:hypothetical protein
MKKLINEYMYWLGTVKISNFLNSLPSSDLIGKQGKVVVLQSLEYDAL